MKKQYTKKAIELMEFNKVDKLYHTSDGEFFLTENSANNHALREHGKMRKTALKVEEVKAEQLGLKKETGASKSKEELEAEYDILFEKTEKAKAAFEKAEELAKAAKGSDKEKETEKQLKEAEKELKKLTGELEKIEKAIENAEN